MRSKVLSDETHQFAILRNCSRRFRGKKVMMVYLEVMTWFEG